MELAGVEARPGVQFEQPFRLDVDQSVANTLDARQRNILAGASLVLVASLLLAPIPTLIAMMTSATVVVLLHRLPTGHHDPAISPGAAHRPCDRRGSAAVPDADLPVYTVLVPAYREAGVIGTLLTNLRALEYPRSRLDVKLILEEDDHDTIAAARERGSDVEIILVEEGGPRTKPNALNRALQHARAT